MATRSFSQCKLMPFQCELNHDEFQERNLKKDKSARAKLVCRVRPRRCPYCGEFGCMILHSWCTRYMIDADGNEWILLIPVFKCRYCRRHIRVLPLQCHSYCIHVSQSIRKALSIWISKGHHSSGGWIPVRLVRHWIRGFLLNVKNKESLYLKGLENALHGAHEIGQRGGFERTAVREVPDS